MNRFDLILYPDDMRWAAAESVSEDVIAAVLLLHERSVDEIVPKLSAAELEQLIKLVGRSPSVYPPGTLDTLKQLRNSRSPQPSGDSGTSDLAAKEPAQRTAGARGRDTRLGDHSPQSINGSSSPHHSPQSINGSSSPHAAMRSLVAPAAASLTLPRSSRGKESQPPIRRNRKNNLQENRSAAAQFRQKPLLGKAQSPISFNALEILHGRRRSVRRARERDRRRGGGRGRIPNCVK
jgi:hypothetical protein